MLKGYHKNVKGAEFRGFSLKQVCEVLVLVTLETFQQAASRRTLKEAILEFKFCCLCVAFCNGKAVPMSFSTVLVEALQVKLVLLNFCSSYIFKNGIQ